MTGSYKERKNESRGKKDKRGWNLEVSQIYEPDKTLDLTSLKENQLNLQFARSPSQKF